MDDMGSVSRLSKTKERILAAALDLFNIEGEANVVPADIAHALGISPGNLYYHYKGKEPIIRTLFARFDGELRMVLGAPRKAPLAVEDNWVFLYIIFEEIYDFRFFYSNLTVILDRDRGLLSPFRSLIAEKARSFTSIVETLRREEVLAIRDTQITQVAQRAAMFMTHWPAHQHLISPDLPVKTAIHDGVYALFSMITPFMGASAAEFEAMLSDYHRDIRGG